MCVYCTNNTLCTCNSYMPPFFFTLICLAPRRHPPDPPIDPVVRNKTDSSITLCWSPPESDRPVPIKGYYIERKKLGAHTWVKCNTTSTVPYTHYTVNNITEEGNYEFRISAVNDFGRSSCLEVPGTFFLGE